MSKVDLIAVCYDKKLHQFKETEASELVIGFVENENHNIVQVKVKDIVEGYIKQQAKIRTT
jgi:hypothetical protein